MKSNIEIFNIDTQKHVGTTNPKEVEQKIKSLRTQGYSVLADRDGDLCIDYSDDDEGKTYQEMMEDINS